MKKFLFVSALVLAATFAQSQTADFSSIKSVYLQGLNAIIENNEVKGYSAFYFLDKADKKESVYEIRILDNNLKETHSVKMTLPKQLELLENSFNGERFCYSFINPKEKSIKYMLLDKTGQKVGAYTVSELSSSEMATIEQSRESESNAYSGGMVAVPGLGFVRYGWEKKKGYHIELEMFDNAGKKLWRADSKVPADEKSYESAYPFYANSQLVVSLMTTRPKALSMADYEMFLTFHKVSTGKEAFRIGMKSSDKKNNKLHAPIGVSYDEASSQFYIYGEYYMPGQKMMKDKSTGLYFQVVDTTGKIVSDNYSSWTGDIAKKISMNDKGKFENNTNVTIHKMIRTTDGKIFAIGEQFKKAASALGIASQVLSRGQSGSSVAKIEIFNMMVFEYSKDFSLTKVHVFEKDKTNVELPRGMGMLGPNSLAYMMKMFGWFDYEFTTTSPDKATFTSAYVNYDKDKEQGNNYAVGGIAYTKDAALVSDKIRLTDKPTWFRVLPAKPGYVSIFEYYKKEKKISARLEKLNL
jgi:ACT domain-containing protein